MPIKFQKDVSTHLFKYLRQIDISFNREYIFLDAGCSLVHSQPHIMCSTSIHIYFFRTAFDQRTRSARELLRQVQAKRFTKANPNLKINVDVHNRAEKPLARFALVDGTEQLFETHENNVKEIMFQVHLKAMELDADYELAGKSIDES
jgi:hypothetical protein